MIQIEDHLEERSEQPGPSATSEGAPELQPLWVNDSWLSRGPDKLAQRLKGSKRVPVRLGDYLTDELNALASKCLPDC